MPKNAPSGEHPENIDHPDHPLEEQEWDRDPTRSPDPFEMSSGEVGGDAAPVDPGDGYAALDPAEEVRHVVGSVAPAPDPIRVNETPEKLRERLGNEIPPPDTWHMPPAKAKAEVERHTAIEELRKAGLAVRDFKPSDNKLPKAFSASEREAMNVEAYRGALGELWSTRIAGLALGCEVAAAREPEEATDHLAAADRIRRYGPFNALAENLERWSALRAGRFEMIDLAKPAKAISESLSKLHGMEISEWDSITGRKRDEGEVGLKGQFNDLLAHTALEFARQAGEHLSGGEYVVPPQSQGPVFSLREDTSIYTGAGRAIKRMKEAVKELTAGRNPAPRWSADISSAEQSYTTKLKEYDKNQERTGRIDLVRLGELAASADAFALACLGARAELERAALKHAAGDPFDPSRSLAQLDAIAMAAVLQLQKEIAAGGIDAELKLKPIRDRFRLKVIRERTLDREPSSMWAETLKDATNDLPADWETERKRAFGDWMKTTSLDERLKEWARRARDMPKGAVDYLAATRKVKEAIGRARGGALAFLPKTKGGLLYACLDDIALHVAATTARYHSLFPGEL